MRIFKFFCLAILLGVFTFPLLAQDSTVDFFGYYTIEKAAKGFTDISEIHLAGNYGAEQKPPFHGLIRLKSKKAKDFHLLKPTLDGKNLTFTTKSVSGISYTFSGAFTRLGNFPSERPEAEVLLTGTLTKLKGKTKLTSAKVSFIYTAGD